ncbi:C40 family peptidase [Romboutsia weinsteinii]|nr:SH3 domain-containing protein [Romboutsia weinsteinii]
MIRKSVMMSIGIGAAALAFNTTEASAAEKATVTADVLNVRSGAGTSHSVIGKLYNGNTVEIISTSNGWHNVKLSNGKTGWVSAEYISVSGSTTPSTGEKGTVTADALNVRSGAGTGYSITGKLYRGNTVEILSSSNGWYNVKLSNGKTGWVSAQYVTVGGSSNEGNNGSTTPSTGEKGTVTADALNVRSGASTSYSVIGKLYKGNTVEILSSSNGWHNVKLSNGSTGWVSAQYVTMGGSSNEGNNGSTTPSTGEKGTVNADTLNVRSGAGTNYSVTGKLYKGNTVEILSSSNGWHNVKLSNGNTGWVSAQYITIGGSSNEGNQGGGESTDKPSTNVQEAIVNEAKKHLGKPYVWGAEGPGSFDCSGLTYYVYKNAAGITLPRVSRDQSKVGTTIGKSDLQPGDLLFSSTDGSGGVNHVGIYIGGGQMIHAPQSGDVVKTTNINTSYWNNAFLWAKRVI